ncbi:MAG TPA: alpha-2-macroglobulin family protein, partial [Deinococcales bacterium]|nr:alpha-2-macroglobulin family protein [Deinococcales bacterium]
VEGNGIRRAQVLRGAGAALSYSFPVTADMAPNVFLTAAAIGQDSVYTREARVRVPPADRLLDVSVGFDRERYAPGETGSLTVKVTGRDGRGVAAELGLGVVDEAIYLVRPDAATPISRALHGERDNAVGTSSSFGFYIESVTAAGPPRAPLTRAAFAAAKEEKAQAASPEDRVREDFQDTILWIPDLLTGPDGTATVPVTFPDNLTTWRATGRAITVAGSTGQATGSTVTTKDLIARPALPAFLVRGDTTTISTVVNNNLAAPVTASATLALSGLTAAGGTAATLSLPAGGRARQDVTVTARQPGTASVEAAVRAPAAADTVRLPLDVLPRGPRERQAWASGTGEPGRAFTIPADALLAGARVRLDVTPSLVAAVAPALEYLLGYPYGCTEQTMSRFFPALLARATLGSIALSPETAAELPGIITAGLERLARYQHADGGWGFWENDDSSLEMTAYVLHGLVVSKALGAGTGGADLAGAVRWLRARARDPKAGPQGVRAYTFRVLAEAGSPDLDGSLALARRSELRPYALANLALALSRSGRDAEARDLLDRLKASRREGSLGVHWSGRSGDDAYLYWEDNDVQVTALALQALARLEPSSALVPRAAAWLLAARHGPRWTSTQDTAAVIEAATAMPRPAAASGTVTATLNGTAAPALSFTSATRGLTLDLPASALRAGENRLEVDGPAGLTYSVEVSYHREPSGLAGSSDGLSVTRRYDRLVPRWDDRAERYVFDREALLRGGKLAPVTVGDLILVTLVVRSDEPVRYLAVTDPLPAGARAVEDRALAISGISDGDWDGGWGFWYAGRELRDRSVNLFATFLNGQGVMRYVMRARTPGTFAALPTEAFLMYDPEVRGTAPAATLTVRDRGQ